VRVAVCGHLTRKLERAASRHIKLRAGAPIPPGYLATGDQDRSIGKAGSKSIGGPGAARRDDDVVVGWDHKK